MDDPRQIIDRRVREWGVSMSALSVQMGRNAAWLQQYLRRGTPRVLPPFERHILAKALDLDEAKLGAPQPWLPAVGRAALG